MENMIYENEDPGKREERDHKHLYQAITSITSPA